MLVSERKTIVVVIVIVVVVAAEFTLLVHDDVACDIVSHVRDKLARCIKT